MLNVFKDLKPYQQEELYEKTLKIMKKRFRGEVEDRVFEAIRTRTVGEQIPELKIRTERLALERSKVVKTHHQVIPKGQLRRKGNRTQNQGAKPNKDFLMKEWSGQMSTPTMKRARVFH